jgi:hypothetical protein
MKLGKARSKRVTKYQGLYRENLGKQGTRFRIVIRRNKKTTQEYFYFGAGKSEVKALASATKRWKQLRKSLPVITRATFAEVERRKSPTGIVGVRRTTSVSKGHEYEFWEAWWSDRRHRRKCRRFSVKKYGEARAKTLAIKARREGLAKMN